MDFDHLCQLRVVVLTNGSSAFYLLNFSIMEQLNENLVKILPKWKVDCALRLLTIWW